MPLRAEDSGPCLEQKSTMLPQRQSCILHRTAKPVHKHGGRQRMACPRLERDNLVNRPLSRGNAGFNIRSNKTPFTFKRREVETPENNKLVIRRGDSYARVDFCPNSMPKPGEALSDLAWSS